MALVKCPECTSEISSDAKSCPKCGKGIEPPKKSEIGNGVKTGYIIINLIMMIWFIINILPDYYTVEIYYTEFGESVILIGALTVFIIWALVAVILLPFIILTREKK
jgi:hypothetical protein